MESAGHNIAAIDQKGATPLRQRIQFSLRDLCWAMLLVAVASGWFVDHRKLTLCRSKLSSTEKELKVSRWKETQWLHMLQSIKNPPKPKRPLAFVDEL